MKKYFYGIVIGLIITLFMSTYKSCESLKHFKELYNRGLANVEAYQQKNAGLNGEIREFKYTMDELRASNDSVHQKLLAMSDKLKIKDKMVTYMQYQTSVIHKTDTIKIKGDTIFQEKLITQPIDTVVGDKWYNMKLKLEYPSTIVASPTFNSEKYVIVHTKKEYNKKPSKIFFIKWFQKKHTVVTVDVVEENPYIESKESRFINIVKD